MSIVNKEKNEWINKNRNENEYEAEEKNVKDPKGQGIAKLQ